MSIEECPLFNKGLYLVYNYLINKDWVLKKNDLYEIEFEHIVTNNIIKIVITNSFFIVYEDNIKISCNTYAEVADLIIK